MRMKRQKKRTEDYTKKKSSKKNENRPDRQREDAVKISIQNENEEQERGTCERPMFVRSCLEVIYLFGVCTLHDVTHYCTSLWVT